MKTINFITPHFLPENNACTNRVIAYIDELRKKYKINVISLTQKGNLLNQIEVEYNENVKIFYINQSNFNGKNFFIRAFNEIKYVLRLIKKSQSLKCDITMTTTPYMFIIPFVAFHVKGKKILDIRDLVWEYLDDKTFVSKNIKTILSTIMRISLKKYDKIIVTNEYEYDKLHKYNPVIIANGIDRKKYNILNSIKMTKNNIFTITYIGNIGLAQNILNFVKIAEQIDDIKINIIGSGLELDNIKQYINEHQLNNVHILGKLNWDELLPYYEETSVLYAQLDAKYISAMPSKLYEYASTGLPIVYSGNGQAKKFIEQLDNSYCVTPCNEIDLIKVFKQLKDFNLFKISNKNKSFIYNHFIRDNNVSGPLNVILRDISK